MKVLISGRKGKLQNAVVKALSGQGGIEVRPFRMGLPLLEVVRSDSFDALILALEEDADLELVRWVLRENPTAPLLAVVPRGNSKLCEELADEGVSEILEGHDPPGEFQKRLRASLEKLRASPAASDRPGRRISSDLHTIRSTLTAIQGYAELASKKPAVSSSSRKPQEEIVRGVREIERLLRRIERGLKIRGITPG